MKIAVIGAGAIGCLYGAYLSRKNEVTMLCRREKVADSINRNGLIMFESDRTKQIFKENVKAFLSGECREAMDLVILIVKGGDTRAAMEANRALISDHMLVMTL